MYKITATIHKSGGLPVEWARLSKVKLTKPQCEEMISRNLEVGKTPKEKVTLTGFKCVVCKSLHAPGRVAKHTN